MSDITNESERKRRLAERRRNAQAVRAAGKRRKAQILREMVASLDKIIGRPHDPKPPALAVLISDAIVAGEVAHTKVVF